MVCILKISIAPASTTIYRENEILTIAKIKFNIAEFLIVTKKRVNGPEILKCSPRHWELSIPERWQSKREKAIASLRRTIAGAALEFAQKIKPSIVYALDVDLCGLAGVLISRSLNCPLILGLSEDDALIGLYDERKVSVLDSSITAANGVIVTGDETASIIRGYYPTLQNNLVKAKGFGIDNSNIQKLIQFVLDQNQNVPWTREPVKSLLVSSPQLVGQELNYVEEVLRSGWWGYGLVSRYLEELFNQWYGENFHALAVSNCTDALHLALIAAGIGPGDEVIVPSLTFVSTAAVVIYTGATLRFADIEKSTLNITSKTIECELTKKTRAIIPVHFAGVPCDIHSIKQLVKDKSIVIIEDAAHAIGAKVNGYKIGFQSPFACFSFAPTKQLSSCDGGVLLFQNEALENQLREISNMGLHVDTYQRTTLNQVGPSNKIERIGYRYRMNDITAAIAVAQLQQIEKIISHRTNLVAQYTQNLSSIEHCELLKVPPFTTPSWYIIPVRVPSTVRDTLREHLASKGVDTSVHYPVLNEQPAFRNISGYTPVASSEAQRLISLPLHYGMTKNDVNRVCEIIVDFLKRFI